MLLIAVSKTYPLAAIEEALACGQRDFGENFAQEAREKFQRFSGTSMRWHFIGHLQTNKIKYIIDDVSLIHSVDSIRLADALEEAAKKRNRNIDILLEVHTTGEATKTGMPPEQTVDVARQIARLPHVRLQGLMTMGPLTEHPEDSRQSFKLLADLRRAIEAEHVDGVTMRHLSMGMTHDFRVAIEEGATMLRIGTAIFGKRADTVVDEQK